MKKQGSTVTSKGQMTLPVDIRKKLQSFITDGSLDVVPNRSAKSLKGILPKPSKTLTIEEIDEVINGMYDRHL